MSRTRRNGNGNNGGSPPVEPGMMEVSAPRARGRPRLIDGPCDSLSVRLPVSAYDRLIVMAERRGQSVSAYVREVLIILTGSRDG